MGLFDWLSEGMGSSMGGSSMPPGMSPGGPPPMPPVQQTGADAPSLAPSMPTPPNQTTPMGDQTGINPMTAPPPFPPGGDPMAAGGPVPNGPGLPSAPPYPPGTDPMTAGGPTPNGPGLPPNIPLPAPRPAGANGAATLPPAAAPTAGAGIPPNPPPVIAAPPPTSGPQAKGIIGRALGLDPNREAQVRGSLGAGLKAAGENANKPGLAAFAGSMGSGIEGGKGADDKTTDQQSKYLTQAIAAAKSGDERALNQARTQLALAQAKQTTEGKGGKDSVVNSDQQLYLRAQSAAAQDGRLKALKTQADQASTQFGINSPEAKAALKAHKDLYDSTVAAHATALGIDPKKAASIGKQPGMSQDNPVPKAGLDQKKFDALPVGAYFINPKDGKLLMKQPPAQGGAGANPQGGAQPSTTPAAPPAVTAPAGSRADTADDEE